MAVSSRGITRQLLPYSVIGFLGYLAVGIPLPVLPIEIHGRLGYGAGMIGLVIGAQSLATLATRQLAGYLADRVGAKRVTLAGLMLAAVIGVLYWTALRLAPSPIAGIAILFGARLLLGLAESLFITGALSWAISMVGLAHSGRAMAWNGMAMYSAIAFGAPFGTLLEGQAGFGAVCVAIVLAPLIAIPYAWSLVPAPIATEKRERALLGAFRAIWAPGLAIALASSGFGTMAAFLALRFDADHWANAGLALTGFGLAYMATRLLLAHLPDRAGGRRVAMPSLVIEAVGLLIIWQATSPVMAILGATVTGFGYSLVFPALGVEVVKRTTADTRAMALGGYLACFDLGWAAAGPIMGLFAGAYGLSSAFLGAAGASLLALAVTARFVGKPAS